MYQVFKFVLIGPVLWLFTRPRVIGRSNIPDGGPVILAANHAAFIDSLLLCWICRRRVHFLAKREYFTRPGITGRLQRWFFTAVGQIPVDRDNAGDAAGSLEAAVSILVGGGVWGIHPEGTRVTSGVVHRGRTGVMRVAERTGAPVIPVAIRGSARVNPPGSTWWRLGRVEIVVGAPLSPAVVDEGVRSATNRLMQEIAILAALDYHDAYAR